MPENQCSFFATRADLLTLLKVVEAGENLRSIGAGIFDDEPDIKRVTRLTDRLSEQPDGEPDTSYLLFPADYTLQVRVVGQRGGGQKFALDQLGNPGTVVLRPGGRIAERCLLAGQCGTTSREPISVDLFGKIHRHFKKTFVKVRSFYLGDEADGLLNAGWRFVTARNAPPHYDLKRN